MINLNLTKFELNLLENILSDISAHGTWTQLHEDILQKVLEALAQLEKKR